MENLLKKVSISLLVVMMTFCAFTALPQSELNPIDTVEAASTYSVTVSSKNMYSYAYQVLDKVNAQRKAAGLSSLTMDKDLLSEAMTRARELSIYYSHTRPNGSSWTTAIPSNFTSTRTSILGSTIKSGENIAAGQTSATNVMTSWMNSSGHKANILSSNYSSIGIGCAYIDGTYYWVQTFSSCKAKTTTKPSDATANATISYSTGTIKPTLSFTNSIKKGATTTAKFQFSNGFSTTSIASSYLTYSSSNTKVATINSSGVITGVATGTATITVKHKASGYTLTKTITITNPTSIANMTATLSQSSYTYSGSACKPTVSLRNGSTIVSSNYYTVTYSNNTNVGKATVKITGKNGYSGTITKTFTINPKATTLSSVTAGTKAFTVKWAKLATQTTGYQIQYSTSSSFSNAKTVTVSSTSTTSKTVSSLSAKTKYYVRIRTYKTVSGTNYYSSWSSAKNVTTK